jgi:hypothetical protein
LEAEQRQLLYITCCTCDRMVALAFVHAGRDKTVVSYIG